MRKRQTFREILEGTAGDCSRRVAERALLANRAAKTAADPASRAMAYAVKSRALTHGIERFGERWRLVSLERDGAVIALRHDEVCLHLPLPQQAPRQLLHWLHAERGRVAAEWRRLRAFALAA